MSSGSVWIKTEPTVDGSAYVVTLEADEDSAVVLDPERAWQYASAVMDAAHRAAYDAAVYAQLAKLGIGDVAAAKVIQGLREDRPPLDAEATHPMGFDPGVSWRTKEPFLIVLINGEPVGQWTFTDARIHALTVIESVVVADLDSGYYRALLSTLQLDPDTARRVVEDVGQHRVAP